MRNNSLLKICGAAFFLVTLGLFVSSFIGQSEIGDTVGIGTRTFASQSAPDTVNASTVLVSSDLVVPIAKGQHLHVRYSLPFSLAATAPGIKFQVTVPTGGSAYNSCAVIYSDADSVVAVSNITAQAAQGFTLATTGNHYAVIEADIINGSTAGNVSLQFAQNVSNASNVILMKGAFADVIKF